MNKTFRQRLREVRPKDILHIFLFLFALLPAAVYRRTHAPFWLVCEYGDEARDNGYYFFRYVRTAHPEQPIWYAIHRRSADHERVASIGKTVEYGSFRHWVLYLAAAVNLSSQKGGKPNAAVCYALEVYGIWKNKRVFLQHGVTMNNITYAHWQNARFALFITSTGREQKFVENYFGYPKGAVRQLGMCRFDDLADCTDDHTIVIMPTWRQWLKHDDADLPREEYFRSWRSLLRSGALRRLLEETDTYVCFYPHREMQRYTELFADLESERVHIAKWPDADVHELLKRGAVLITDYSSVAMDFAYMDKPVIYYQFDRERFRSEHLAEGYFSYEQDGFGPVAQKEEGVLSALRALSARGFQMDEKCRGHAERFFDLKDHDNCARTYEAVKEL